ncbi:multidrug effflux MFS transporter [Nocardia sp. KC 131]|uniref:multidrug effflux MFS transporter n=1 Tax=Nocardia arseniciresistens TaxID=3392119 RepID=UPI00398E5582
MWLIVLLGALSAFGPIITDVYLPALPQAANDLHTTQSGIQYSLIAGLLGLAAGQLVVGPISDSWGRRRPMIAGMAAFAVTSALCAAAVDVYTLDVLRLLQGFAGGTGVVISFAIVRDRTTGRDAARAYSILSAVGGMAPIVAPIAGAQLLRVLDWRGLFLVLAGLGVLFTCCAIRWVPETLPAHRRRSGGFGAAATTLRQLAADRVFVGYALTGGFSFAALFAYISASPFVFQHVYHVSPQLFGIFFAVNGAGFLVASNINAKLVGRFDAHVLLAIASVGAVVGALGVLSAVTVGNAGLPALVPPLFFMVSCLGFTMPNSTALALDGYAGAAGSASAILGLFKYALGSAIAVAGVAIAPLVGGGGRPMAVAASAAALLAIIARVILVRQSAPMVGCGAKFCVLATRTEPVL